MGKRGPAPCNVYGAAAISHALYGVDFPVTKQEMIDMHGERVIEFTKNQQIKLRDILDSLPDCSFNSPAEVESELYRNK